MPEQNIEQSLFPDIVPDRPLGDHLKPPLNPATPTFVESLKLAGISENGSGHYGRIVVASAGLLEQGFDNDYDLTTPDAFLGELEYWKLGQHGRLPEATQEIQGYVESFKLVEFNGTRELALRIVKFITDIGIGDDNLLLVKDVQSIAVLSPNASEFMVITENNEAGLDPRDRMKLNRDAMEICADIITDYLRNDPEFRVIWTPAQGAIDAWG